MPSSIFLSFYPGTNENGCNPVSNWISLKIGARQRNRRDRILGSARILAVDEGAYRRLSFFILSCLIFRSSVDRGIPSLAAAPFGPATFPLLSARAASMSSFSYLCRCCVREPEDFGRGASWLESQASSIQKVFPLQRITDLSTMFCSSRILPGQG